MTYILQKLSEKKALTAQIVDSFKNTGIVQNLPETYVSRSGLTKSDIQEKVEKMGSCCSDLIHKTYTDGTEKIIKGNHCQNPSVCPLCSSRIQGTRRARLLPKVKKACKKYKHVYKLVLTIEDRPDLHGMIRDLKSYLKAFRKQGQQRKYKKRSGGEWRHVRAGFMSFEVKRGSGSGLWHVHAHAVVWCSDLLDYSVYDGEKKRDLEKLYGKGNVPKHVLESAKKLDYCISETQPDGTIKKVPMSKLQLDWFLATGGNGKNVDCERLQKVPSKLHPDNQKKFYNMQWHESIAEQCKEILKYDFKYTDFSNEQDFFEVMTETRGSRFLSTFGDFRGFDYDRIVTDLRTWLDGKGGPSEGFAKWILKNTDLRNMVGKKIYLTKLNKMLLDVGIDELQIEKIYKYFCLDGELLDEYTEPDVSSGQRTNYEWSIKEQKYIKVSMNGKSGRLPPEATKLINQHTGKYRRTRKELIDSMRGDRSLSFKLDELKRSLRADISNILEFFKADRSGNGIRAADIKFKYKNKWQKIFDTSPAFT